MISVDARAKNAEAHHAKRIENESRKASGCFDYLRTGAWPCLLSPVGHFRPAQQELSSWTRLDATVSNSRCELDCFRLRSFL